MTLQTPKIIISLLTLLLFTLGVVSASNNVSKKESQPSLVDYKRMSTPQLQKEVEKLANQDKLPFEVGLELMKRWSNK